MTDIEVFPSPLGVSYFQIMSDYLCTTTKGLVSFRPLSGYLISKLGISDKELFIFSQLFPSPLGVSYFQIRKLKKQGVQYVPFPSPLGVSYFQILPARARYFAGFSDSFAWQIFFLYLTYTIASKCSIYAVRGKIIFFSNKLLHTPILTHIFHVCIEI